MDETELSYRNALIEEGVTYEDAERAAHIFFHVDGHRRRTEEEQDFVTSIWRQVVGDIPRTLKGDFNNGRTNFYQGK